MVLLQDPGSPTESSTGPVELDGETIILTDENDPEDAKYDFDGDGTDEPARVDVVFEH